MKRALLLLAALAAAGWAWWRFAPDTLPAVARQVAPASPVANPPLYKWRDAEGRWQVTGQPPADRPYETVVVDPATNVVPPYGSEPEHERDD